MLLVLLTLLTLLTLFALLSLSLLAAGTPIAMLLSSFHSPPGVPFEPACFLYRDVLLCKGRCDRLLEALASPPELDL
jgi:hypothetical protein